MQIASDDSKFFICALKVGAWYLTKIKILLPSLLSIFSAPAT